MRMTKLFPIKSSKKKLQKIQIDFKILSHLSVNKMTQFHFKLENLLTTKWD